VSAARILVVDDDAAVLHTLKRVLEPAYEVCTTNSPLQAAELARAFEPDIAICDVQMPQLSGFDLLDRLRAAAPGVDTILMTGSFSDHDTHLIRALRERAFYFILKPFDRDVLLALVERCAEMRRLRASEFSHLTRMRKELQAAQAFQQAMLAAPHAELPHAGATVDVQCRPCSEVGGDFYDYIVTAEGELAFILADVRGHGVPAALLTATVKTVFRSAILRDEGPAALVAALLGALQFFGDDQFVTAFCGRLDGKSGRLTYVNAGHPAALVFAPGRPPHLLKATAPLISAIFPAESWKDQTAALPDGARLLLHTDGIDGGLNSPDHALVLRAGALVNGEGNGRLALAEFIRDVERTAIEEAWPADDTTVMLISQT
jgi:DNA-binding response OmpR family regulator